MKTMTRFEDLDIARTIFSGLPSIAVLGLGRAGAVAAGCLAAVGHRVHAVDNDPERLATFNEGRATVDETGLTALIDAGIDTQHLIAERCVTKAVAKSDILLVTLDLETRPDGTIDVAPLLELAGPIGLGLRHRDDFQVIVVRSAVPPGTTADAFLPLVEAASGLTVGEDFGAAYVPCFLRPGRAVADFRQPSRTVIGALDARSAKLLKQLFAPFDPHPKITSMPKAEMAKHIDDVTLVSRPSASARPDRPPSDEERVGGEAPARLARRRPVRAGPLFVHANRTFDDDEDLPAPVRRQPATAGREGEGEGETVAASRPNAKPRACAIDALGAAPPRLRRAA